MTDYDSQITALERLSTDDLTELYNSVRTANGRVHDRAKFTVVVRHDDAGNPTVGDVMKHQQGSHFLPEGSNTVTTITLRGHPFMNRGEFNRRIREIVERDLRAAKANKEQAQWESPR